MIPTAAAAMRAAFAAAPGAFLVCCLVFALWPPIGTAAANEVTDWNVIIEQTAIEQTAKASSVKPGVIHSGDASRDCVEGRMLSGNHFRFSDEDALYLGQHISRYVLRTTLAAR